LTDLDRFTVLMAALLHDLDHPGVNQSYLQNSRDDLCMIYNDQTVLEMYHCSFAFNLFFTYEIVSNIPDYITFRRNFIQLILATDMSQHFILLAKFKTRMNQLSPENSQDRLELMKIILKSGDVSNLTRPFPIAKKWAERCLSEFHHQGDLEKRGGFPVGALNDRENFSLPKSQIGFSDYIGRELFIELVKILPRIHIILDQVEINKLEWSKLIGESTVTEDTCYIIQNTIPEAKEEVRKGVIQPKFDIPMVVFVSALGIVIICILLCLFK
jgi:hypothetical protein